MESHRVLVTIVFSAVAMGLGAGLAMAAKAAPRHAPSEITPRVQVADRCVRYDAKWSYFPVQKTAAGSMCDTATNFSIEPENTCRESIALGYCVQEEDGKVACSYQALAPVGSRRSVGVQSVFCNPPSNASGGVLIRYRAYMLNGDASHDQASRQALRPLLRLEHYVPVHPRASLPPFPIRASSLR